jgi:DUF4097 and DUF4098 domain-containing protein YvlB
MKIWLVSLAAAALIPGVMQADEWTKHWTVTAKPEVRILAGDAAVVVEAGADGAVEASVTTRGWSIGNSGVQIIEHQSGNRVEIEVKVPSMHFDLGNHSIRVRVRVPREVTGDLKTGDGSIELRGLHGSVHAVTGDGSVQAEGMDGMLDVYTGDGSVKVKGRFDGLQVHTKDGSVELGILAGSRLQSEWRVQTGDGSVRVSVPRDLAADIEMRTGDGHIQVDVPLTVSGRQDEHQVQGKFNGGGPALLVRTGDGSITLNAI